ncbi:MAG: hypothetical protein HYU30_04445 [Chloroflexi bacterium]|nr:hypothetical protein [Chloroflexota bacterium]
MKHPETYRTLERKVLDLINLTDEEMVFLTVALTAYKENMSWERFSDLVAGRVNPLVAAAGGRVNEAVWGHPLFQAARDMEDRLGLRQGMLAPEEGCNPDADPFEDQWLPAAPAAQSKGVTVAGLHRAIKRGQVIARPAKPGGRRIVVSANSLRAWTPDPVRQSARKGAAVAV